MSSLLLASGNTRNNRVFPFFIFRKEFMSQLAAVFDIDDTLCDNRNRDYENALSKRDVIKKLNQLHRSGYKIVLYTSRGMVSCGGDREKATCPYAERIRRERRYYIQV